MARASARRGTYSRRSRELRSAWDRVNGRLRLSFGLDPGEVVVGAGQGGARVELVVGETSVGFDSETEIPHPDLLAVGALTVLYPWITHRLQLNHPISRELAETLAVHFAIEAGPVDSRISARSQGTRIGISFGAGEDSAAVARILPPGNPLIHLRRSKHRLRPSRPTNYRPDVLADFAREFENLGFESHVVESDIENICLPHPTFPTWPSITLASILHADRLDLGSIATGTVLGSRYFEGGSKLYSPPHPDQKWEKLFAAAGIPLMMPLAGATEVTTGEIVRKAGWDEHVRSCPVGSRESPCRDCMKCFRKEVVSAARARRDPAGWLLDHLRNDESPILRTFQRPPPFPTHHNYEYAFSRIRALRSTKLAPVLDRMRLDRGETRWVERYYPGSIEHDVPPPWRPTARPGISSHVIPMNEYDRENFLNWDASTRAAS